MITLLVATSALAALALVTAWVTLLLNLKMHARALPHAEMRAEFEALSQEVSQLADFVEHKDRRERVRRLRAGREDAPAAQPTTPQELKAALRQRAAMLRGR